MIFMHVSVWFYLEFYFFSQLASSQYFRTLLYIMESDAVKNTVDDFENENDWHNLAGNESEDAVNDNGKYKIRKTII